MCLHGALKNALKLGMLMANPADAVTPPPVSRREMATMKEKNLIFIFFWSLPRPRKFLHTFHFFTRLFPGLQQVAANKFDEIIIKNIEDKQFKIEIN
jgi:hypothetical protein